jgi:hypothetical protein
MDRLFTNVVQALLAVMLEPTIIAVAKLLVVLILPPNMAE